MTLPPLTTTGGAKQRLECITVSVNCAAMLRSCLANNMRHVDHMIVATTPLDFETQRVCQEFGATAFITDAFYRNGAVFDKGRAHDESLRALRFREFVLFIDVDMILHGHFRPFLCAQRLNVDVLYGADRVFVTRKEHVDLMVQNRLCGPIHANEWGFGHFQLFNMQSKWLQGKPVICRSYPTPEEPLGLDDYLFREQFGTGHAFIDGVWNWDPTAQQKLPILTYHMGPPGGTRKVNGIKA